ncbi:MAG: SPOR domain-containing protein, partial [Duncaniella sp.]|nr:SPOR domain-containing protein [Duncaniella sp.]
MNTLALHIEYLLLRHDCVIVPGLGAFLVHRDEARLEDGRRLLPPVRTLGFNSELTLNDGLLAGSVARRDSITYEAARQRIGQCVESFIHQLRESGTVPLGRLGTLSVSPESKGYIFEPAE